MGSKMRALVAVLLCSVALSQASCSSAPDASSGLPSSLASASGLLGAITAGVPGLSQAQAILAAGTALSVAQNSMPAEQFSKISNSVPGASGLMGQALKAGLPAGVNSLSGATDFLTKNGITADQVRQVGGVLSETLKTSVPSDVAGAFAASMK